MTFSCFQEILNLTAKRSFVYSFCFTGHFYLVFIIFMIRMTLATSAYGNEVGFKYAEQFKHSEIIL